MNREMRETQAQPEGQGHHHEEGGPGAQPTPQNPAPQTQEKRYALI